MRPDPLDQYAPAPTPPVTADAYIRYSLVRAWAAWTLLGMTDHGGVPVLPYDQQRNQASRFAHHFTTASLLFALDDERYADPTAADLWDALNDGAAEITHEWLTDAGINPDHIRDTALAAWRERTAELAEEGAG